MAMKRRSRTKVQTVQILPPARQKHRVRVNRPPASRTLSGGQVIAAAKVPRPAKIKSRPQPKKDNVMAETMFAALQRKQIEATIGELLLTDDFYMRLEIVERLRHLIAHADPTLDKTQLSEGALEELHELHLLQ